MRKPWVLCFQKNPSWKASAGMVFSRVLFYLPSSLFWLSKESVKTIILGLLTFIAAILCWVGVATAQVIAGLCGYLTVPTEKDQADVR